MARYPAPRHQWQTISGKFLLVFNYQYRLGSAQESTAMRAVPVLSAIAWGGTHEHHQPTGISAVTTSGAAQVRPPRRRHRVRKTLLILGGAFTALIVLVVVINVATGGHKTAAAPPLPTATPTSVYDPNGYASRTSARTGSAHRTRTRQPRRPRRLRPPRRRPLAPRPAQLQRPLPRRCPLQISRPWTPPKTT